MLPVSRSVRRTRHAPSPSGNTTRQPSLKSNRSPFGPGWVGSSAGAGYGRLAGAGAEPFVAGAGLPGSPGVAATDAAAIIATGAGAAEPAAFCADWASPSPTTCSAAVAKSERRPTELIDDAASVNEQTTLTARAGSPADI